MPSERRRCLKGIASLLGAIGAAGITQFLAHTGFWAGLLISLAWMFVGAGVLETVCYWDLHR